jgi:hypothetical protein
MMAMLRNAVAPGNPRAMITDNTTNDYNEMCSGSRSEFKLQLAVLSTSRVRKRHLKIELRTFNYSPAASGSDAAAD